VPDPSLDPLRQFLVRGRNADGGWGYYAGKSSRLEPTAWSLLALGPDRTDVSVLSRWPADAGLLLERAGGEPNFGFHGAALLALRGLGLQHQAGNAALLASLQQIKGIALEPTPLIKQDGSLQAWPWIAGTFSWVEPTAWCLLALKRWAPAMPEAIDKGRVDVAERMIVDRCCRDGGWNYGNADVMGQQLKPFVPTTAVALLAMQDRTSLPVVDRSRQFLEAHATTERSGVALALAAIALKSLRLRADGPLTALREQIPTILAVGNHLSAALALLALEGERDAALVI
jgi:hypothetical protein